MNLDKLYFEVVGCFNNSLENMNDEDFYSYLTMGVSLGFSKKGHLNSLRDTLRELESFELYERCAIVRDYIKDIEND